LQAATYATISPKDTGRATALYNVSSQVASSLGVAVAAAYLTSRLASRGAALGDPTSASSAVSAFQDGFLLLGVIAVASIGVALLIRDRDAAATLRQRHAVDAEAETASLPAADVA
jgi:hypothetical protein